MKMIKDFFISSKQYSRGKTALLSRGKTAMLARRMLCLGAALASVVCLISSCETMDSVERDAEHRADQRSDKRTSGRNVVYHGLAFDIMIPAEMKTNTKKTEREIIHYFFTSEMAQRRVGMGIYEGLGAKSMVRMRKDLIEEESTPAEIGLFVGNVQRGVTYKGKRWSEYFLFPKDSNFTLQIWWFDVEPEDEAVFREVIHTIRATYPKKDRD